MVRHKAVGPDLDASFAGLLGEQVAIDFVVAILEEDRFAPVSTLGYMVRKPWDYDTGESGHTATILLRVE